MIRLTTLEPTRKFKPAAEYSRNREKFYLLPFRFVALSSGKELLVNELGDFLITPRGTAKSIAEKSLDLESHLYKDLISNNFISSSPVPSLIDNLATRYRTKKSFLDSFTALHIFVVTLRCNHSCHYCQVSRVSEAKSDFDISDKDLEDSIQLMFKSPSPSITMEFQGGEPLLAFEKIKTGVERAKALNELHQKEIKFVICTNATIYTDEILAFCKLHDIIISTSLDGPEFIHNSNRPKTGPKSYQQVIEGINQFKRSLGDDKVSCLMTTTLMSLDHPKAIIDEYVKQGLSNIFLRPISPYGFALKNPKKNAYATEKFLEFYEAGLEYILQLNKEGYYIVEDYTVIILKKILTPFPVGYVDLQSPAGLINNVIVYNYDGAVYASDESRMLAENGDYYFRLGHVSHSYESIFLGKRAMEIARFWSNESLSGCSDCAFQPFCGADPVYHYAIQGDLEGTRYNSTYCQKNMAIFKYLFTLLSERENEVMPIFSSWIKNSMI